MNIKHWRDRVLQQEDLNFLLTNRIPRHAATHFMGWFSRIRSPWLTRWSIALWRQFTELDLSDAVRADFEKSSNGRWLLSNLNVLTAPKGGR